MTTQFARASYQEIVDLHTESDTVSVIGIHTPQGDTPRKMFGGFYDQFKKFKYLGCSISLVPAARLPADPLQVSYDAGEATIDPRDMLNPLMFHGCHGNDMGVILNRLYSLNSVDGLKSDSIVMEQDTTAWTLEGILAGEIPNFQLEDLYYKALTDNTWKKAHPQRGFRKSGLRPLVYKMSTNMQMLGSGQSLMGVDGLGIPGRMIGDDGEYTLPVVQSGRQFFTPGLTGLGWLDTRNVLTQAVDVDYDGSQYDDLDDAIPAIESAIRTATLAQQNASESSLPLVYMGMILLPPAYKTEQYFRMIINHHFAFKDFRGISFSNNLATTPAYSNFNDEDFQQGGADVDPDNPSSGGDDSGGGSTSGDTVVSLQSLRRGQENGRQMLNNWTVTFTQAGALNYDMKYPSGNTKSQYAAFPYDPDTRTILVSNSAAIGTARQSAWVMAVLAKPAGAWYAYVDGKWSSIVWNNDGTGTIQSDDSEYSNPDWAGTIADEVVPIEDFLEVFNATTVYNYLGESS